MIVQSESAEFTHELRAEHTTEVQLQNKLRFASLDLLYAHHPDWLMAGEPPVYQIIGNDYNGRNEKIMLPNGEICTSMDVPGWYNITHDYYQRYKKPVMHTETNVLEAKDSPTWLWKQ